MKYRLAVETLWPLPRYGTYDLLATAVRVFTHSLSFGGIPRVELIFKVWDSFFASMRIEMSCSALSRAGRSPGKVSLTLGPSHVGITPQKPTGCCYDDDGVCY